MAKAQSEAPLGAKAESVQLTQLIDRHIQAIGGQEILRKIQTARIQISGQDGQSVFSMGICYKADGKMALEIASQRGVEARQVRDEHGTWWRQDSQSTRKLTEDKDLLDLWAITVGLEPAVWLRNNEFFVDFRVGGREKIDGREVNTFRAATLRGGIAKFYFDASSSLLVRVNDTSIEDYQEIGGANGVVRIPHRIRQGAQILQVTLVQFNPNLNEAMFIPPQEVNSLIKKAMTDSVPYFELQMASNHLGIVRFPARMQLTQEPLIEWPLAQTNAWRTRHFNLRSLDLSGLDLRARADDLLHADFDTETSWPKSLPDGFEPKKMLRAAMNPGLGIRQLHERGLVGKGVGIALIDQTLLVDHQELTNRIKLYEEFVRENSPASLQGCAMASLAVGKTVGVAPGADLYYLAGSYNYIKSGLVAEADLNWMANAIGRILEVNQQLPVSAKIRVIGISAGGNPVAKKCEPLQTAIKKARAAGMLVLITGWEDPAAIPWLGASRVAGSDPDAPGSYGPGYFWRQRLIEGKLRLSPGQHLLVPMDPRSTASGTGTKEYVYYAEGFPISPIPYLAGLYALACQANPKITPAEFRDLALKTGSPLTLDSERGKLELGSLVNPTAIIDAVTAK